MHLWHQLSATKTASCHTPTLGPHLAFSSQPRFLALSHCKSLTCSRVSSLNPLLDKMQRQQLTTRRVNTTHRTALPSRKLVTVVSNDASARVKGDHKRVFTWVSNLENMPAWYPGKQ